MRCLPPAIVILMVMTASIAGIFLNNASVGFEGNSTTKIPHRPTSMNSYSKELPNKHEIEAASEWQSEIPTEQIRVAETGRIYIGYEVVPLTRSVSKPEPGYTKIYGYVGTYIDGEFCPLVDVLVEAWDVDIDSANDLLASNTTDSEGFFEIKFSSTDGFGGIYRYQDVILKMYLDASYGVVQNNGTIFFGEMEKQHNDVADGEAASIYLSDEDGNGVYDENEYFNVTVDDGKAVRYILENSLIARDVDLDANGNYYISNPDSAAPAMILWYIYRATLLMKNEAGVSPPKVYLELGDQYTSTNYNTSDGKIYVSGNDQNRDWEDMSLVLKEYAKFLLDKYSYLPPSSGFYWNSHIDEETAWVEGFGAFFGSAVKKDTNLAYPYLYDDYPYTYNLEEQYDDDGSLNDEDICGAVAGILWDLLDTNNDDQNYDGIGDYYSISFSYIWDIVDTYNPTSIIDFYTYLISEYSWLDEESIKEIYYEHGVDLYGDLLVTINADPREGVVPLLVSFSATVSGGSPPYSYTWYIDGDILHGQSVEYVFYSVGTHVVVCYVEDSIGKNASKSVTIVVYDTLSLSIDIEPEAGGCPLHVTCTAYGSGGKEPYSFQWDFGDGHTGTGSTVEHTYTQPGRYTITCTMTDARGDEISASYTINVYMDLRIDVTYFGADYTLSIWVDKEKYENTVYSHQYTVNRILSNIPSMDRSVVETLVYLHMHLYNPDDFPVENVTVYDSNGNIIEDYDVRERLYQEVLICSHVIWIYISQEVMNIYLAASAEYEFIYEDTSQLVYLSIAAALISYIFSILAPIYDALKYKFGNQVQELVKKIVTLFTMMLFGKKHLESHVHELTGSGGGGAIEDPHEATMTIIQILKAYGLISSDDYNPFELYNNIISYPDLAVDAMEDICNQVLDIDIANVKEITRSFFEELKGAFVEKFTEKSALSFLLGMAMGALAYFYFDVPFSAALLYGALVSMEAFSVIAIPVALAAVASVIATHVLSMTTYEYLCWRDLHVLSLIYKGLYLNGMELLYPYGQRLNLTASEMFLRLVAIQRVTLYHYYANLYLMETTKWFPDQKNLIWYSGNASQQQSAVEYWLNFFTSIRRRTWYRNLRMKTYMVPMFILDQDNESVENLYVKPINPFPEVPENPSGIIVNINNTDIATLRLGNLVFMVYNKTWYTNFTAAIYAEDPYRNIYMIIFNPPDGKYELYLQEQASIKIVNFDISEENISMETVVVTSAKEYTFRIDNKKVKRETITITFAIVAITISTMSAILLYMYISKRKKTKT